MTDVRRVCDLTAAELLDAAWAQLAEVGVTRGGWNIRVYVVDGKTRAVKPQLAGERPATIGRRQLDQPREAA